ncbi:MAG: U32 family peptidase [Acidobacteriota bacterium]
MPKIVEIGISALKIEGRYKDAEYVSLTTRAYREAVDNAARSIPRRSSRTSLFPWPRTLVPLQVPITKPSSAHGAPSSPAALEIGKVLRVTHENVAVRLNKDRSLKTRRRRGLRCRR